MLRTPHHAWRRIAFAYGVAEACAAVTSARRGGAAGAALSLVAVVEGLGWVYWAACAHTSYAATAASGADWWLAATCASHALVFQLSFALAFGQVVVDPVFTLPDPAQVFQCAMLAVAAPLCLLAVQQLPMRRRAHYALCASVHACSLAPSVADAYWASEYGPARTAVAVAGLSALTQASAWLRAAERFDGGQHAAAVTALLAASRAVFRA